MRLRKIASLFDELLGADLPATINDLPQDSGEHAAILRAAHQILDTPVIFSDPFALRIIGRAAEARLRSRLEELYKPAQRALCAFMAVRSRYTEDELARAVQKGVRQYVILGAGLDTFAYRNPFRDSLLRVFEVDHPTTQAFKRRRLEEADIAIPNSVTFVALDFERQGIADALSQAGFRSDELAFFSWLGVTRYLRREAAMSVLASIHSSTRTESEIVFDFTVHLSLLQRVRRLAYPTPLHGFRRLAYRLIGNRTTMKSNVRVTRFDPASLTSDLKRIGFADVTLVRPKELNTRYCRDRADGLRAGSRGCLVKARV